MTYPHTPTGRRFCVAFTVKGSDGTSYHVTLYGYLHADTVALSTAEVSGAGFYLTHQPAVAWVRQHLSEDDLLAVADTDLGHFRAPAGTGQGWGHNDGDLHEYDDTDPYTGDQLDALFEVA